MMPVPNWTATLLLLAGLVLSACERKPADRDEGGAAKPRTYTVVFKQSYAPDHSKKAYTIGDFDIDGARVSIDGVDLGVLRERDDGGPRVVATLANGRSFDGGGVEVMLSFPTPCGKNIDVRYVYAVVDSKESWRRDPDEIHLRRTEATVLPKGRATIYVDEGAKPGAKVAFGTAAVDGPIRDPKKRDLAGKSTTVWDVGCAPKHVVTIDGIEVGVAAVESESIEKNRSGFLVSVDATVCYRRELARYGDASHTGPGGSTTDLPSGQVVPTGWNHFEHFLERPPSGAPRGETTRSAIYRVPCEAAHEKARQDATKRAAPKGSASPGGRAP